MKVPDTSAIGTVESAFDLCPGNDVESGVDSGPLHVKMWRRVFIWIDFDSKGANALHQLTLENYR